MVDAIPLLFAVLGGGACGAWFFGGLRWTIRRGLVAEHPAVWFFASSMLRTATVMTVFFWLGHDDWTRLVACLLGFVAVRAVMTP